EIGEAEVEQWIRAFLRKRRPHLERSYRAAWEALGRSLRSGTLRDADLAKVVRAARAKESALWQNATGWLAQLAGKHPEARQAVRAMARDKLAHVRFSALCCLGSRSPRTLLLDVILPAINDKSSRVRWKAADIAGLVELREGVPVIAERRRVERNPKVQRTLDFILPRLGDAHTLEERDGELFLTVRRLGRMKTERVSKARIRRRGLPTIVEEWRQELESSVVRIKYLP
ncbi:MAG TPA: hypothetical protein VFB66_06050, partial [Tepidisphaeraceae bacterium]|nr:hypothetical protein [Tepidisphaeraceae bacterium]